MNQENNRKKTKPPFIPRGWFLQYRIDSLNWLKVKGFDEEFIYSVMNHDSPDIKVLRRLIDKKVSVKDIMVRYRPLLDLDIPYD